MTEASLPIWSVHDIFVQVNVVHGYRYLDLTGVALNVLSDRYRVINLIAPEGTSLSNPVDTKDPFEIQFGAGRIWLHYVGIDAVQKVDGIAPDMMRSIAEKLEMKEFDRYGVRVVYFIPSKNVLKTADSVTRKIVASPISGLVANRRSDVRINMKIPLVFNDMEVIFRFGWITIQRPPVNPTDYDDDSLILDIDIGQRSDGILFRRHDLSKLMTRAIETHSEFLIKYGQPLLQGVEL
jgi:hypothetical protein